jgi:LruC domain-containing protein
MKFLRAFVIGVVAISTLYSCKKDDNNNNTTSSSVVIRDNTLSLQVPNGFNFETTDKVNLQLSLGEAPVGGKFRLKVYTENPSTEASSVYEAFIEEGTPLTNGIVIPQGITQLYLVLQVPDGSSFLTILPRSQSVSHTFYTGKSQFNKTSTVGPDCSYGCDVTRTHSGNWTADKDPSKGTVYCVTGTYNGSGGITLQDESIVRLCGTGTIPIVNINSGVLEILNGADVIINNLNLNSNSKNEIIVYDGGSLTITNNFSPNADFENFGTMTVAAINLNSNSDFNNEGTFTASNNSTFNGDFDNHGTMTFNGNVSINSGSKSKNYCGIYVNGDLQLNGEIENKSFMQVTGLTNINNGGKLKMKNGAMNITTDLTINGKIDGSGSTSLFKTTGTSNGNNGAEIKEVQYCDEDGIESFPSNIFKDGAVADCSLIIPADACNPVGNGVTTIADADNDGVADNIDSYPNDPLRAADVYFPGENTYGTVAYEDLWPAYGDYDFNDLVVDYRYQQVVNADNKVVDLKANFATLAIGGALKNGFGIQLDVASGDIASVSGTRLYNGIITNNANGTEAGQTLASIIIYDDASQVLPNTSGAAFVNTVSVNPYLDPDTSEITINFATPQDAINLGDAPYNPFIFIDQTRGREVHLAGQAPTDLADPAYFGSLDDDTKLNDIANAYKSDKNLPWAIHVMNGFAYPEEKKDVSETYQYFSIWAQSAGLSYTDWYEDQPSYVDQTKLYQNQ